MNREGCWNDIEGWDDIEGDSGLVEQWGGSTPRGDGGTVI